MNESEPVYHPIVDTENHVTMVESGKFKITYPEIELTSDSEPLNLQIDLKKSPTTVRTGDRLYGIIIDTENSTLKDIVSQARQLQVIPESDRPRQLHDLVRSNISYAYDSTIADLAKHNPALAQWIVENTGLNASITADISLSDIFKAGYGVCRHIATALLVLGKEAGLDGSLMNYYPSHGATIDPELITKNVRRKDNGQPLFKSTQVGEEIGAHTWVEFQMTTGEWLPVDPSTQLIGDNQTELATFQEANYLSMINDSLVDEGLDLPLALQNTRRLAFKTGQSTKTGNLKIGCMPKPKKITLFGEEATIWPSTEDTDSQKTGEPNHYKGPLNFSIYGRPTTNGMNVEVQNVTESK